MFSRLVCKTNGFECVIFLRESLCALPKCPCPGKISCNGRTVPADLQCVTSNVNAEPMRIQTIYHICHTINWRCAEREIFFNDFFYQNVEFSYFRMHKEDQHKTMMSRSNI